MYGAAFLSRRFTGFAVRMVPKTPAGWSVYRNRFDLSLVFVFIGGAIRENSTNSELVRLTNGENMPTHSAAKKHKGKVVGIAVIL